MVTRETDVGHDDLHSVPGLRAVRVSRRYRRALQRLSGPRAMPSRALAAGLVLLVFALGFILGRLGGVIPSEPTVRALPLAQPLTLDGVQGSAAYVFRSHDAVTTVAVHDLYTGDVVPRARFSPPFDEQAEVHTRFASLGRSVAVIVDDGRDSFVAFAPRDDAPHGWIPATDAAWVSEHELLVRQRDGTVVRWTGDAAGVRADLAGHADALLQTPNGAVQRVGARIEHVSTGAPGRSIAAPPRGRVLAASIDGSRLLIDDGGPAIWDGRSLVRVRADGYTAVGASFERSGDRVALLLDGPGGLAVAVADTRGNAAIKPIDARAACASSPAWDASGTWIYVAPGDGSIVAVESSGGLVKPVRIESVGCGIAWTP